MCTFLFAVEVHSGPPRYTCYPELIIYSRVSYTRLSSCSLKTLQAAVKTTTIVHENKINNKTAKSTGVRYETSECKHDVLLSGSKKFGPKTILAMSNRPEIFTE